MEDVKMIGPGGKVRYFSPYMIKYGNLREAGWREEEEAEQPIELPPLLPEVTEDATGFEAVEEAPKAVKKATKKK
jgi:hypothetical protein